MGEFREVVRNRRMTRSFRADPVEATLVEEFIELASRAPSAGKTQGWHALVLEGADQVGRYWDLTLPVEKRTTFRWTHLLDAPVLMVLLADPAAYVERYGEPDKVSSGLGHGVDAWPAPYWTIDASMAAMVILLAAEDHGLGALFFGLFRNEGEVRGAFAIPDGMEIVGVIALGHPLDDGAGRGRSADRPRRSPAEIIHRGRWRSPT